MLCDTGEKPAEHIVLLDNLGRQLPFTRARKDVSLGYHVVSVSNPTFSQIPQRVFKDPLSFTPGSKRAYPVPRCSATYVATSVADGQ